MPMMFLLIALLGLLTMLQQHYVVSALCFAGVSAYWFATDAPFVGAASMAACVVAAINATLDDRSLS